MIYSGSIWVPIVMHALWDFPLVTIKGLGHGHVQISWGDVMAQFFENGLMIAVGLLLVWMGDRKNCGAFAISDVNGLV